MVFVSIEFDVMVDVELGDDDDGDGDDSVGDVVVIIDRMVFNGEPAAWAWLTDACDACAVSAAQANWHWTVILFGNVVVVTTVCTGNGYIWIQI